MLIHLNILILTILLYLIIRQSIKLFVERKKKIPGSLFKKNLLFAFSVFSVVPSIFVFFIASKLIAQKIDKFSILVTFVLITLLILFLSIWCAFYLAKGISKPIQELLQAQEKVRNGILDVSVNSDHKNDLKGLLIGFNEMVTSLKEAHKKLESKNKEMSAILQNIKASVFFVNNFGRVLTYNSSSKILVQKYLDLDRFKNKKINFFGPKVQKMFFDLSRELLQSGKTSMAKEISFAFKNETKTLMVYLTFIENSFQLFRKGILVVIEDLTDIVKANKIKTWQEAAKQIAHEIKNPLTPIQLATQRLQRKLKKEQNEDMILVECTNTILNHVKIIRDLISHFSAFSSMPISKLEPLDINKLIKETTILYKLSYPNIKINYELESFLPLIKLDEKKIKRVIVNLIDNSIRATKHTINPSIKIKTSFKTGLNQIELLISDNGPGIPKDVRNKLFLPYVSGSKKNMGLGLAIVHDIVTQLNGSIKLIESDHGASFQMLLPI